MEKLVWVTEGKMEHQAWLLEEIGEAHTVLVRWESLGTEERVPVWSVRLNMPSRRSRKTITKRFNYDERVEAEENSKLFSKQRGSAQPGRQKQKARKNLIREAMTVPASAIDDASMASNDSSQELKNLHLDQECSISAQHENLTMDAIASPTVEATITPPKKHQRSSGQKLVWVTAGKMEHQAWLLEEIGEARTVLVRWESTGTEEQVPVFSVRLNMPSPRSRKPITKRFNYDERVEAEEMRKLFSKKRGRAQPGRQKEKARKNVTREAMTAPASAIDDTSMALNDSSQELKNLHLEQECSISAQHKNSKMDDIPSPTVEVRITRSKNHQQSSGPIKKRKRG
jgi:hypothetical protein